MLVAKDFFGWKSGLASEWHYVYCEEVRHQLGYCLCHFLSRTFHPVESGYSARRVPRFEILALFER